MSGGTNGAPVTALRGASVSVDTRVVRRVVVGVVMAALLLSSVVFFVVGARKNAEANALGTDGVVVEATVVRCLGLLGGSGSNAAGYSCTGSYGVGGKTYEAELPGTNSRSPGTRIPVVVDRGDPGLVSTPGELARNGASDGVYVVPTVLLGAFVVMAAVVFAPRRPRLGRERQPALLGREALFEPGERGV